jgi:hypothetical protein
MGSKPAANARPRLGTRRAIALLSAATLAVALFVLGCGGDSASISKAEFTKQAEAVCKQGEKQLRKDLAAFLKAHENVKLPSQEDVAELVHVVFSGNIEAEVKKLRAIEVPTGDEKQVKALIDAREESLKNAEANPLGLNRNAGLIFAKARKLAKEYGLKECTRR